MIKAAGAGGKKQTKKGEAAAPEIDSKLFAEDALDVHELLPAGKPSAISPSQSNDPITPFPFPNPSNHLFPYQTAHLKHFSERLLR